MKPVLEGREHLINWFTKLRDNLIQIRHTRSVGVWRNLLFFPPFFFSFFWGQGVFNFKPLGFSRGARKLLPLLQAAFLKSISPYVGRYGYKDLHKKDDDFEKKLFHSLSVFVRLESMMEGCTDSEEYSVWPGNFTVNRRAQSYKRIGGLNRALWFYNRTIQRFDAVNWAGEQPDGGWWVGILD